MQRLRLIACLILFVGWFIPSKLSAASETGRYTTPVFNNVVVYYDILYGVADPYGILSSQDLKLDIYVPQGDTLDERPLIVYAFGGAFIIGDKQQPNVPGFCEHFAKLGYVVASIDYRLGFTVTSGGSAERAVYRGVQDLRAALRFLVANADTLGIHPDFVFTAGSSAGCFMGLHSAVMEEIERPASTYGITLEPSDLGCVDCSGNNDYGGQEVKVRGIINQWGAIGDTNWINAFPHDSVPIISFHGTQDNLVPFTSGSPFSYPFFPAVYGSAALHERLNNLGVKNELIAFNGAGHEPQLLDTDIRDTIFQRTPPFLYDILKPATPVIFGPDSVCVGDTVEYWLKESASQIDWMVGNGLIVDKHDSLIRVTFTSAGLDSLIVGVCNEVGAVSFSSKEITTVSPPDHTFSINITAPDVVVLTANSFAGSSSWNMGNGDVGSGVSYSYVYPDTGWFWITHTKENDVCSGSYSQQVYIAKCPLADFTATSNGTGTIQFSDASQYTEQRQWHFGDGGQSTQKNPSHTYTTSGSYTVTLIASNSQTGCIDTLEEKVEVFILGGDQVMSNDINIYPNPIGSSFTIESEMMISSCVIVDMLGAVVFEKKLQEPGRQLRIQDTGLSKGIYQVIIENPDGVRWISEITK